MAPDISGNLSRISTSAKELNQLADKATGQIRALNEYLTEMNIGVEVYDSFFYEGREKDDSGRMVKTIYNLGYARDDASGTFGLVVLAQVNVRDEDGKPIKDDYGYDAYEDLWVRPLDKVSRHLRIKALANLSDFVATLAKKLEETTKATADQSAQVDAVVNEIKMALMVASAYPQAKTK